MAKTSKKINLVTKSGKSKEELREYLNITSRGGRHENKRANSRKYAARGKVTY